jgi:protein-tyrosine phosphatase
MIIEEVTPGIIQANSAGALEAYRTRLERNIGGFVNVAFDIEQEYPGVAFLRLMLNDDLPVPAEWFDRTIAFQKGISATGQKTLVHCRAAVNRSTAVIAAMMVSWGMPLEEALRRLPRKPYSAVTLGSLREWAAARL